MSETDMRGKVVSMLRDFDAIAVENPCLPGTPDVNFTNGWIELKWIRSWPKKESTVVSIDHYTKEQKIWHYNRRRHAGNSWLLLQVRREWLLFDGGMAVMCVGRVDRETLIGCSYKYWKNGIVSGELKKILSNGCGTLAMPPEVFMKYLKNK